MISENIIKTKFITDTLKRGTDSAFKSQGEMFVSNLKSRSGNTLKALTSPDYTLVSSGSQFQVVSKITRQLRFQDLGVRKLYTWPLWKSLRRTYMALNYGLSEEIKANIRKELEQDK